MLRFSQLLSGPGSGPCFCSCILGSLGKGLAMLCLFPSTGNVSECRSSQLPSLSCSERPACVFIVPPLLHSLGREGRTTCSVVVRDFLSLARER